MQHPSGVAQTAARGQEIRVQPQGRLGVAHGRGLHHKACLLEIAHTALHVPVVRDQQDALDALLGELLETALRVIREIRRTLDNLPDR